jgi:Uncharacterized NAD(FAD)-dependent dehydrogenases
MSRKRVVVAGGVAARASWATTLRRLDENADVIAGEARLPIATPAPFRTRFNIVIRTHKEATAIDRDKRLQTGGRRTKSYDALALAPGAAFPAARKLPFAIVTHVNTPALFDEIGTICGRSNGNAALQRVFRRGLRVESDSAACLHWAEMADAEDFRFAAWFVSLRPQRSFGGSIWRWCEAGVDNLRSPDE